MVDDCPKIPDIKLQQTISLWKRFTQSYIQDTHESIQNIVVEILIDCKGGAPIPGFDIPLEAIMSVSNGDAAGKSDRLIARRMIDDDDTERIVAGDYLVVRLYKHSRTRELIYTILSTQ